MKEVSLGALQDRLARKSNPFRTCLLELTFRCNLDCLHCYVPRAELRARRDRLTGTEINRVLDRLARQGTVNLVLTGGEPLCHPDFDHVYRHAKRLGLLVSVFTNGTLIDETRARLFAELAPLRVEVTLQALDRKVYERITRVPGSYRQARSGIDLLLERNVPLTIKTVGMRANRAQVLRVKAFAESLPGVKFRFDPVVVARLDGSRIPLSQRLPARDVARLEAKDPVMRQEVHNLWQRNSPLARSSRLFLCAGRTSSCLVDPLGRLHHCYAFRQPGIDLAGGRPFAAPFRDFVRHIRELNLPAA